MLLPVLGYSYMVAIPVRFAQTPFARTRPVFRCSRRVCETRTRGGSVPYRPYRLGSVAKIDSTGGMHG
jgi:hypothetical protein